MIEILRKIKGKVSDIKERIFIEHYLSIPETRYPSIQRKFLTQHLKNATKHVQFYHSLLSNVKINTSNCFDILRSLPIVGKNDIEKRTDLFYADYVTEQWKAWHNTGGSTGEPFKFPVGVNT